MTKSKMLQPTEALKHPKDVQEWNQLLSKAIKRAEETGDRRLEGLRQAMTQGRSEKILRSMSILSESDLNREFK